MRIRAVLTLIFLLVAVQVRAGGARVETVRFTTADGAARPYVVVLPADYDASTTRYPVLYLLHGLFGHYTDWTTRTNLADYASRYRMIVVTPEGGDGWYVGPYETYIVKELIPDVDRRYRTIDDRRGRGIAGLSMGGYGALKFAVKYPDTFAVAESMSGALDPATRTERDPGFAWDVVGPSITAAFGPANDPLHAENDLAKLYRDLPADRLARLPYLYLDCGTEDGWLASNRTLAEILLARKIPHEFRQMPGRHDWSYWDARVRYVLELASERMPLR